MPWMIGCSWVLSPKAEHSKNKTLVPLHRARPSSLAELVPPMFHLCFSLTFCAPHPQRHQRQVQMAHCLHLFEQWRRKWNLNPFIEQRTSITEVTPFAHPTQCTQCSHSPHEHLSPKGFFSDLKLLLVMLYGPLSKGFCLVQCSRFLLCFLLTISYYYSFISCVWICYLQVYLMCVWWLWRSEGGFTFPGSGVTASSETCVGAGKETGSFGRTASSLNCWAIFQFCARALAIYFSGYITLCLGEMGELSVATKLGVLDLPFVHAL